MSKVKCKGGGTNLQNNLEGCYCIVHFAYLKEHGSFIPFTNSQGDPSVQLVDLNTLWDNRLCKPFNSTCHELASRFLPHTLTNLEIMQVIIRSVMIALLVTWIASKFPHSNHVLQLKQCTIPPRKEEALEKPSFHPPTYFVKRSIDRYSASKQ